MSSLRFHLFSRFLAVIILQVLFASGLAWFYLQENFQQTLDDNYKILGSVKKSIEYYYQQQVEEFQRLTESPNFINYNKEKAKQEIAHYLNARGMTSTVHYYLPTGELEFAQTSRGFNNYHPEKNARDHKDRAFVTMFDNVLSDKKVIYSPPLQTKSGVFFQVALIPVLDKEKLKGIISLAFFPRVDRKNLAFEGLSLADENFLAITDTKGHLITVSNLESKHLTPTVSDYISKRGDVPHKPLNYVRKDIEQLRYEVNGQHYYLLSRRIKDLSMFAILGVNESVLKSQKEKLVNFILAITGLSTLIGLIAALVVSRRVTKGLELVLATTKDIRLGKPVQKVHRPLHRDFKEALNELNDLSIEIEKGKLLGNLWGQDSLSRDDKKNH